MQEIKPLREREKDQKGDAQLVALIPARTRRTILRHSGSRRGMFWVIFCVSKIGPNRTKIWKTGRTKKKNRREGQAEMAFSCCFSTPAVQDSGWPEGGYFLLLCLWFGFTSRFFLAFTGRSVFWCVSYGQCGFREVM